MQDILKVSIGGLYFSLHRRGYKELENYLMLLKDHYLSTEGGDEIIEGIEERIAELFLERTPADAIVSDLTVEEVIKTLGSPSDIDGDGGESRSRRVREHPPVMESYRTKRRLFRDGADRVLGGVCSGLAAYFDLSTTLVRVLFIVALFFSSIFSRFFIIPTASFVSLLYIVLWIVIPKAKSVEERHLMRGEPFDLASLERRGVTDRGRLKREGREIEKRRERSTLIAKIIGMILIAISVIVLGVSALFIIVLGLFKKISFLSLFNYLHLGVANTVFYKVVVLLVLFLPLVALLYLGLKMAFKIKIPKVRLGLIIFFTWLISVILLVFFTVKATTPYWHNAKESVEIPLELSRDTLAINFIGEERMPNKGYYRVADHSSYAIFWLNGEKERIAVFPEVNIVRQSESEEMKIKYVTRSFASNLYDAQEKASESLPALSIDESGLRVMPTYYDNKENRWDGTHYIVYLYLPANVEVVVESPTIHRFDKREVRHKLP